ncbi:MULTISPECIES: LysR family transcriptional regulator [Vibrio]|uniref:LysR family transcriptional regulator n=1 Tax=Vibrio TaxID=662 RepID=UPI00076AC610|nr:MULTISPECIES: LysR family transcriptional regulator [Vibrio]
MHSLDQLYAFVSVYEHHSYSAAGRHLGKDRTTVRELVKAYEDDLGFELFIIEGRKALATPRAEHLYPQTRLVLRQNQKLQEFSQAMFDEPKMEMKLGYDMDFPIELIAELERRSLEQFPQMRIHWLETNREQAIKAVSEHKLDFAILPAKGSIEPEYPCAYKHLGYVAYGLFVNPNSDLAYKTDFGLEDAQLEVQYLMHNHVNGEGMIQAFSTHTRVVSNHALLVRLLENGGWTLLPLSVGQRYAHKKKLKKINTSLLANNIKVPFSLFHPIGMEHQITTKALVTWCSELATSYFR